MFAVVFKSKDSVLTIWQIFMIVAWKNDNSVIYFGPPDDGRRELWLACGSDALADDALEASLLPMALMVFRSEQFPQGTRGVKFWLLVRTQTTQFSLLNHHINCNWVYELEVNFHHSSHGRGSALHTIGRQIHRSTISARRRDGVHAFATVRPSFSSPSFELMKEDAVRSLGIASNRPLSSSALRGISFSDWV